MLREYKTNDKGIFTRLVSSSDRKTRCINGSWQERFYYNPVLLDPVEICKRELIEFEHEDTYEGIRPYKYGYVGRICTKKGFYKFIGFVEDLNSRYAEKERFLLDLLLWNTDEEHIFLNTYKKPSNLTISTKNKEQFQYPNYSMIRNLILPYESIGTSIAVPFVPIEALLSGCNVFLPASLHEIFGWIMVENKNLRGKVVFYEKGKLIDEVLAKG